MLAVLELGVRRLVAARGEPTGWLGPRVLCRIPAAILLTQAVYPAGMLAAIFLRNVEWRGVRYRVRGSWRVELLEDCPYPAALPSEAGEFAIIGGPLKPCRKALIHLGWHVPERRRRAWFRQRAKH